MRVKDTAPLEKRAGVVYQLPCSECESSYIGETKRPLETRLREHKTAIKRGEVQMSAVAEHAWTNQHKPLWGNARVLDIAANKTILYTHQRSHMAKSSSSLKREHIYFDHYTTTHTPIHDPDLVTICLVEINESRPWNTHRGLLEACMSCHTHLFMTSCILFM